MLFLRTPTFAASIYEDDAVCCVLAGRPASWHTTWLVKCLCHGASSLRMIMDQSDAQGVYYSDREKPAMGHTVSRCIEVLLLLASSELVIASQHVTLPR